jgi:hypothetical protein
MKVSAVVLALIVAHFGQQATPSPAAPLEELARAEARWQKQKPAAYEFDVEIRCFCQGLLQRPVTFRVHGADGQPVQELEAESRRTYGYYETVEKLFAAIRRSLAEGQYKVSVTYDPDLGYPTKADIDPRQNVADDELYFRVTAFKKISTSPR